mgnify:CR=1 FL=1
MSSSNMLTVHELSVWQGRHCLLQPLSFQLEAGQVLVLVGESGAGKSLLAQAVMGHLPPALQARGEVVVGARRSAAGDKAARRGLWGRELALLPQEPGQALDALQPVGRQLADVWRWGRGQRLGRPQARDQAAAQLDALGLLAAAPLYPWQMSGGMAQRAALAITRAGGAPLLLADEPTKGLDARWRDQVLLALQQVQQQGGALVVITHDLALARSLGGQLMVLRAGEVVEQGATAAVLDAPSHAFTQALVAAQPQHWPREPVPPPGEPLLSTQDLGHGHGDRWLFRGLNLSLCRGERLAVLGPSGCGKSSLGHLLLGLLRPREGQVLRAPGIGPLALQKLYQDPAQSFPPGVSLRLALEDVLRRHGRRWSELLSLLETMGLDEALLARRPSGLSGGELQRLALARVLMTRPALLFADEPSSRLDPISQRDTVQLLLRQCAQHGTALMLVTHDADMAAALGTAALRLGEAAPA